MRHAGKTTRMRQQMQDRLVAGYPREALLYLAGNAASVSCRRPVVFLHWRRQTDALGYQAVASCMPALK